MTINVISYGSVLPNTSGSRRPQSRAYDQAQTNLNQQATEAEKPQASAKSFNTSTPESESTNHLELARILERGALHEQRVQKLNVTYGQKRAVNAYHEQHLMSRREEVKNMMGFEAYA